MRIAVICRPDVPVPPYEGYGGLQRNIYDFIEELGKRNIEVALFASLDSNVAKLKNVSLYGSLKSALWSDLVVNKDFKSKTKEQIAIQAEANKKLEAEFVDYIVNELNNIKADIVFVAYDNLDLLSRLRSGMYKNKIIWSLRDNLNVEKISFIKSHPEIFMTGMANHIENELHSIDNVSTIIWGINPNLYEFSPYCLTKTDEDPSLQILKNLQARGQDYLVMVSGIGQHKGQLTAIKIAKENNLALILAGTPQDHLTLKKTDYFKNEIEPLLTNDIIHFGNADEQQKTELLRYAKATLVPSGFEFKEFREPFGRVVAESFACGTPVIAYRHGSLLFIVEDKKVGFLFDTFDDAVYAVQKIDSINRWEVRKYLENTLSIKRVVDEYMVLFNNIIQ